MSSAVGRHHEFVARLALDDRVPPQPALLGVPVPTGAWETSGIIDASAWFGRGAWLFDVQAHDPTTPPAPMTVEDGQLLLLRQLG